ncbi:uncharacterized protein G2W53_035061 [Senna tora]|uniref:Uncharacterized protein n=1 Tax=Senna tora TaxID=362788 RepID=A0A834SS75_9FABA|nr:uncharacterized protein G2W53_035061 [Senna tora]
MEYGKLVGELEGLAKRMMFQSYAQFWWLANQTKNKEHWIDAHASLSFVVMAGGRRRIKG